MIFSRHVHVAWRNFIQIHEKEFLRSNISMVPITSSIVGKGPANQLNTVQITKAAKKGKKMFLSIVLYSNPRSMICTNWPKCPSMVLAFCTKCVPQVTIAFWQGQLKDLVIWTTQFLELSLVIITYIYTIFILVYASRSYIHCILQSWQRKLTYWPR